MLWRLYYGDGTTVTGVTRAEWMAAPARNVVGLVQTSERLGRSVMPADLFHWAPWMDRPFGTDEYGIRDHLLEVGAIEPEQSMSSVSSSLLFKYGIKIGRMLNNADWEKIWKMMVRDQDFPVKSSNNQAERVPA